MAELSKSYKQEKITGEYDVIIIGSGLGGLSTAAFLGKEGKRVLVLERHYTPGGFTHVFTRPGWEWDVGVHYVGEVHRKHTELYRLFDYVAEGKLKWEPMDDVYDKIYFGDELYDFPSGAEAFKAKMKTYFPETKDQQAIDKYVDLVYATQRSQKLFFAEKALPSFLSFFLGGRMRKEALKGNKTTYETLRTITDNEKLIAVLTGQYGDYGLPPKQSSFLMHAMLVKHYMNGGNYPVGGCAQFFDSIAPVIWRSGGAVYTNAEVKEIIVKNNKAIGVKMADGKELFAPTIISDAGIYNTYQKLLPETSRKNIQSDKFLKEVQPSVGHICLYIGINRPNSELKLGKANYWVYPKNYDHDLNVEKFIADTEAEMPVVYISFPSSKDPEWDKRFPNKTTIEIITLAPYEWYKQWADKRWKKRGPEYDALKEKFSQRLLEALFQKHPELRGKIDYYELSTPLSTKHFANYEYGELYGIDHTTARYNQRFLKPQTPVKNLYLTGQDTVSCGIGGALVAGMVTACAVTGKNLTKRLKKPII
jgi:all-trans-retinol 13,14-reductase